MMDGLVPTDDNDSHPAIDSSLHGIENSVEPILQFKNAFLSYCENFGWKIVYHNHKKSGVNIFCDYEKNRCCQEGACLQLPFFIKSSCIYIVNWETILSIKQNIDTFQNRHFLIYFGRCKYIYIYWNKLKSVCFSWQNSSSLLNVYEYIRGTTTQKLHKHFLCNFIVR